MKQDSIPYNTIPQEEIIPSETSLSDIDTGTAKPDSMVLDTLNSQEYKAGTLVADNRHDGVRMPFSIEQSDSIFGLLLLCFLFFTHIYNGGYTFLKENVTLLLQPEKSQRFRRQTTSREVLYSYFLIFQAVVLISITIYDIFIENDQELIPFKPLGTILLFMLLIGLFFGAKDMLYRFLGYLFDSQKGAKIWRHTYVVAIEILGILYFLPVLLLVYSPYYHFQIIMFMVILFLFVQILLFYQIIIFFIREKFNFLYLITYLCTFEILPYIFLFSGLSYLYRIDVFNILWL